MCNLLCLDLSPDQKKLFTQASERDFVLKIDRQSGRIVWQSSLQNQIPLSDAMNGALADWDFSVRTVVVPLGEPGMPPEHHLAQYVDVIE